MSPELSGPDTVCAREKPVWSAACTATTAPVTTAGPRSPRAKAQAAEAVSMKAADMAHHGSAEPDITTWPSAASSTQRAANIAALSIRVTGPAVIAASSFHRGPVPLGASPEPGEKGPGRL